MGLTEIDYRGIKVDRCSGCGGLWFDVGELGAVSKTEKTFFDRFFRGSDN
jgi:Zn-finger nucleic acid-binding protein